MHVLPAVISAPPISGLWWENGQAPRQSESRVLLYHLTRLAIHYLSNPFFFLVWHSCAKWLNGLGKGARYDGSLPGFGYHGSCNGKSTGTVAALPAADKDNLRHFIEAQLDAYEKRTGWIFWTWKTESAPEWDMKQLLANGLFPQPLTARQYPNQCG